MKRKLVAILACRNNGSRLYGKPLQNLNNNITILDYLIFTLSKIHEISEIILVISTKTDNLIYKEIALNKNIKYLFGSDKDVLGRLIKGLKKTKATDVFRVTTESPFVCHENIKKIWNDHKKMHNDLSIFSNKVDGMGFEIFKSSALIKSHNKGSEKHRSELCDLYIRENLNKFSVKYYLNNKKENKYRLTVDNPEDLILCRNIFKKFYKKGELINSSKIFNYLRKNTKDVALTKKYISNSKSIDNLWKNVSEI